MEPLTPFGGFTVLNAMRKLAPGETKPIVVQFIPGEQQIYEERVVIYSESTMVSVLLTGRGVKPEVNISPESGLLSFSNVLVGETNEQKFEITNVSSFPVTFNLTSQVCGVSNLTKQMPFLLIPSSATIPAKQNYTVKVIFQPDHESDAYFDVLLIDIPNQVKPKEIYLRGHAYLGRTVFVREHMPFEWRPQAELRKRYEEPLKMLESSSIAQSTKRRRIYLDFSRDEEVEGLENEFEKIKNRKRSIAIGNCRLLDTKMEKAGTYEINPPSVSKSINLF